MKNFEKFNDDACNASDLRELSGGGSLSISQDTHVKTVNSKGTTRMTGGWFGTNIAAYVDADSIQTGDSYPMC